MTGPVFYYDLGDPECYLVAERINAQLPVVPEWEPVLTAQLDPSAAATAPDRARLAARVAEHGLLALRMPDRWPVDSELATLVATWAKRGGKAVAYSLAAFRQAFAAGRDLSEEGTVLIAAAACELHPRAVLKGVSLRSTADSLDAACERARADGVTALPAIAQDGITCCGPDALERAIAAAAAQAPRR